MQVLDLVVMGSLAFALGSADLICPAMLILPHPTLRTKIEVWIASGPTVVRASSRFYQTLFSLALLQCLGTHAIVFCSSIQWAGGCGICFVTLWHQERG